MSRLQRQGWRRCFVCLAFLARQGLTLPFLILTHTGGTGGGPWTRTGPDVGVGPGAGVYVGVGVGAGPGVEPTAAEFSECGSAEVSTATNSLAGMRLSSEISDSGQLAF